MMTGYFREVIMVFSIVMVHELGHALNPDSFTTNKDESSVWLFDWWNFI